MVRSTCEVCCFANERYGAPSHATIPCKSLCITCLISFYVPLRQSSTALKLGKRASICREKVFNTLITQDVPFDVQFSLLAKCEVATIQPSHSVLGADSDDLSSTYVPLHSIAN